MIISLLQSRELIIKAELVIDLDYPRKKARYFTFNGDRHDIKSGQTIQVTSDRSTDTHMIRVPDKLIENTSVGDRLVLGDGELLLPVRQINENILATESLNDWFVSDGRGISVIGKGFLIDNSQLVFDHSIKTKLLLEANSHALSFVENEHDISNWRKQYPHTTIWSKIESKQGVDNIGDIARVSDAIIIARGDLVLQMPPGSLDSSEEQLISNANSYHKVIYLGTEVLSFMVTRSFPTRAEISGIMSFLDKAKFPGILLTKESSYSFEVLKKSLDAISKILELKWK
ncbi:MAG: pyruvate kinase [Bacteroidota bacterium]